MSEPIKTRPPQVTLASGLVIASSVVVVLTAFSQVAALGSLATQRAVEAAVSEPPLDALGLDASSMTDLVRVLAIVSAVAACATGVLGWYVRRPDRTARLGLTVFAVPVFLSGLSGAWLPSSGIAGSFVAAGAAMLWMVPAREWFATGRWTPPPPREQAAEREARQQPQAGQGWPPPPGTPGAGVGPAVPPPADRPYGEPRPPHAPLPQQGAQGQVWHPGPYGQQPRPAPYHRPGGVVAAFVLTVVMAGGLLTLSLLWIALVGLSPELLMSTVEKQQPDLVEAGLTLDDLRRTGFGVGGALVAWSTAALVLSGFLMARRDWARRGLMVLAVLSAVASLALMVGNPLLAVPAAAAVAVVACLRRGDVRRWSSSR
ncbi:hypothetical protein [Nocardioides zeicaulis]|uniref:Uncharacterized protein n=1 Tax=Nocardioides zeicaulis TaxID=1776857 RepID=A0ABV6E068_9ACTN